MSFVDGNAWYWISEWRVNWTSALFYNGNGDLYFAAENNKSNGMYWQIYELPNERFQFRARNSNTRRQLAVCHDPEEISSSLTQPCMEPSSADESQQWTITPWGDGESYKIQNVANGSEFNLDWHPGGPGFISPDTALAPIQPAQHWIFSSIGSVQDGLYSTSIIPLAASAAPSASTTAASTNASTTATTTGASNTSTGSQPQSTSSSGGNSGLSAGTSAGIGVGVALGVIALVAGAFFLLWRRKRQSKAAHLQELPAQDGRYNVYGGNAVPGKTYEKSAPIHEAPANQQAYEMAATPSELAGADHGGYRR